ncbi:MAG TPA: hypothetical protein VGP33_15680 [Chloroflexota bacterium]|nr:hypothetical protein [Chloroflexota bacterium]
MRGSLASPFLLSGQPCVIAVQSLTLTENAAWVDATATPRWQWGRDYLVSSRACGGSAQRH